MLIKEDSDRINWPDVLENIIFYKPQFDILSLNRF